MLPSGMDVPHHFLKILQVLRDFPEEMQGDIAMHLHREVLALPLFENASQGCLKSIALQVNSQLNLSINLDHFN